jgi:hypothetical protein
MPIYVRKTTRKWIPRQSHVHPQRTQGYKLSESERSAGAAWSKGVRFPAARHIVDALTVAGHDRENTWVNILNAPDGAWGIGGTAYTGDDLIAAVTASVSGGLTV